MTEKVNFAAKLALLDRVYELGILGYVNNYKLQVVKIKRPFVWHKHDLLIEPKGTVNTGPLAAR